MSTSPRKPEITQSMLCRAILGRPLGLQEVEAPRIYKHSAHEVAVQSTLRTFTIQEIILIIIAVTD
jgi:hypothetical protein